MGCAGCVVPETSERAHTIHALIPTTAGIAEVPFCID